MPGIMGPSNDRRRSISLSGAPSGVILHSRPPPGSDRPGASTGHGRPLMTNLLLSLLVVGSSLAAVEEPGSAIPAPTNVRGADYPRIHPDLRVTFRIKAPDAKKVE